MAITARVSSDRRKLIIEVDIDSNAISRGVPSKYGRNVVATTSEGRRTFCQTSYGNDAGQYVVYSVAVVQCDAPRNTAHHVERDGNSAPFAPDRFMND